MTNEQLNAIREALASNSIKLGKDGQFLRKDIATVNAILTTLKTNIQDYMAAEAEDRKRNEHNSSDKTPSSLVPMYKKIQFINPMLDSCGSWGNGDRLWLGERFMFQQNPIDGSMILLIKMNENRYASVPMGGNKALTKSHINSILANSEPNHPDKFNNLYEELTKGLDNVFGVGVKKFVDKSLNNDGLAEYFIKYLPSSMIRLYPIISTVEERKVDDNNGMQRTLFIPHAMYFTKDAVKVSIVDHIAEHAETIASNADLQIKTPIKIYTNDENTPALKYIDLDELVDNDNPHPTWDRYFRRFTADEAKVIRAFIWGIFDAKNNGRQLLYIYDPHGYSGKSVMMNAIFNCLGDELCTAIQKDSLNNQFSLAKIWDKRLVVIGDNKNPMLIRSEKIHLILGGDHADIEMKGRNSFSAKMMCKMIASGNTKLEIDPSATHERTRVIVVEPKITDEILKEFCVLDENGNLKLINGKPQPIGDADFEDKLKDEFRSMLAEARKDYEELCPKRSSIILPESMLESVEDMSSDEVDYIDELIYNCFEIDENLSMTPTELKKHFDACLPSSLKGTVDFTNFREHIAKKYGIRKKSSRIRSSDKTSKLFVGIGPKESSRKTEEINIGIIKDNDIMEMM